MKFHVVKVEKGSYNGIWGDATDLWRLYNWINLVMRVWDLVNLGWLWHFISWLHG